MPKRVGFHASHEQLSPRKLLDAVQRAEDAGFDAAMAPLSWNLEFPEQFDAAAEYVRPDDMRAAVLVSADPARHAEELRALLDLGFDGVYLHHVGQTQDRFLDVFGAKVLPELR